jgi:PAS domain S-box-containing protein
VQEEIVGKHVIDFAPPEPGIYEWSSGGRVEIGQDYLDNQISMVTALRENGKVLNWEACYRRKDGKLIPLEQNIFYLYDTERKRVGAVGILRDISERKNAEEQLKEATAFLDNIIESSQDFIIVTTPEGYLTRVNRAILEALDYTEDEMLGKHPAEFAPKKGKNYKTTMGEYLTIEEEFYNNAMNEMVEMVEEGLLQNWEFYLVKKDKTIIPVEENIAYLHNEQGERIGAVGILRDITERKKAEEQIKKTTAFLDNIIASSLDSIVVSDKKGVLQRVNRAFLQLLDSEENQVLGKTMSELSVVEEGDYETVYGEKIRIGKDHIDYMMTMLSQFITEGKIVNWQSYVFRNDRKVIPVEVSIVKLYDEKGESTGSVGIVRDITERRKAERKIIETTDFMENIIASSRDPIIIGDEVGTIVRTNKAFQELLHYEADEVKGKHIGEFVPVEKGSYESRAGTMVELDDTFFQDAETKMTELVEKGSIALWQSCYLGKDGKIVPVEQTISFLYNKFGERSGVVGISRDITDRLKAEQEILRTRDFLQDVFKTSLDGILVTDATSTITMVNAAAVKILGYPQKELMGSKTQKFLQTGDEVEARGKEIQKVLMKKGFITGYEHKWIRKDGSVINLEISIGLLKDRRGNLSGSVLSFRDITERKKAEQKLIESQEQLRSLASQLTLTEERERRRIATDLHDRIGQALAISKIKLGALRESGTPLGLGKDVDGIRDLIEQTIQDTRSLIFDLCPPFLYELGFEKAIEWLLEDIQNQHGIRTHLKSDNKPKQFDDDIRVLLYQTIRELFVNIVKHAEAKNAGLTIKRDDRTITLCVEDDGRGFDEDAIPFRIQKEGGFGLFRIQERFNYLGGEIRVKSKPDQGSKIFLKLPFKVTDPAKKEGIK